MKNIFLFLTFTSLVACKSYDKEITAINDLSTKWDSISQVSTNFSNMLNEANADYTQKVASISIDSATFAEMPAEQQEKINASKSSLMHIGDGLSDLTDDFGSLLEQWNAKSSMVDEIKESTSTNNFDAETLANVSDLSQFAGDAGDKLTQFTQTLELLKEGVATSHADLNGLLSAVVN